MIVLVSVLCAVIGLCLIGFNPTESKLRKIGMKMFFCGLLAFLLQLGEDSVKLLGGG